VQLKQETQHFLCSALEQYTDLRDEAVVSSGMPEGGHSRHKEQLGKHSESISMEMDAQLIPPLQVTYRPE
jgi:hypothetical protein